MIELPVKKTASVLEIGSGHNPHPRSNILCDRFLFDNRQRQRLQLAYDRPLVIAEGSKLPFINNAFDFVFSSQVLEHAQNPLSFAKEMNRVGRSGLIIVPHILRERLFGWPHHRSYFYQKGKILYCLPKQKTELSPFFPFFHQLHKFCLDFRRFANYQETKLNIYFYWKKTIKIRKSLANKETLLANSDKEVGKLLRGLKKSTAGSLHFSLNQLRKRVKNKLTKTQRLLVWKARTYLNPQYNLKVLLPLLRCLNCSSQLICEKNILFCPHCLISFKLYQNIPILLSKKELSKGY